MAPTLLLVSNEPEFNLEFVAAVEKNGFASLLARSGRQALAAVRQNPPEVILLHAASLRSNPRRLAHALRAECYALIVVVASSSRMTAPDADLILKPGPPKRLAARVEQAFHNRPPQTLSIGSLTLDLQRHSVNRGNKTLALTPKEFQLLKLFMLHRGEVITRKTLMKEVWNTDYMGDTRTLDVHIRWLREKIEENPAKPKRLVTRRGEGYVLQGK